MSLAEEMANTVDTTFVSFGSRRKSLRRNSLKIEVYPGFDSASGQTHAEALNLGFLRELRGADAVHCHHFRTAVTSLALLGGRSMGARTFVTELGGSSPTFSRGVDTTDFVDGFLHLSRYATRVLAGKNSRVVYGGVGDEFLKTQPDGGARREQVLCVARLLPHKGINYLIEAVEANQPLELIGKAYHQDFFALLQALAVGKQVRFNLDASDDELIAAYQRSIVTVLPSVYEDVYGNRTEVPELLGLVLLESMACGTPVICTDVGSMPELVEDGVTGFIVPANDPAALRRAITFCTQNPAVALEMGRHGRERVSERFTWRHVAESCLAAYQE